MENVLTPDTQLERKGVVDVYTQLLAAWNAGDAEAYAAKFTDNAVAIGFDGSQMIGQPQIKKDISTIFANHKTSAYVSIVREVRELTTSLYLVRSVVGMIPPGTSVVKPDVNAIQTVLIDWANEKFLISLLQNTPAAFHGRPEAGQELTAELQAAFDLQQRR